MKVLAIRGKNLASLEKEFEVDFTVEPLKSAGIFAITGSTGSGKSTLLDALCMALFDTSPRINHASENVSVQDVGDNTIRQGDSRTILRRGAIEGYAEVDFVSLGGEVFRAQWSVRRAHNKVDGALKTGEIRLHNLSAGIEEQGKKTELLHRISELIGLTFYQFTRSVLLAQGDFSAFLKAKQPEKAELLEKLTGTTIFSRISMAIYEKSKEAEASLNMLKEWIKGIELLSGEQTTAFETEKTGILHELKSLKKEVDLLASQLKWLDEKERLSAAVKQAETACSSALKAIEDAGKRFEYMSQIESAQSIRDSFGLLKNIQKQLSGYKNELQAIAKEREENGKRMVEAQKTLSEHETEQEALLAKQKEIAPQIITARELDVRIKAAKAALDDAQKELNISKTAFDKTVKNQADLNQKVEQNKKTFSTLNQWFDEYKNYGLIVSRTELLINLATDAQTALSQKKQNEKTLLSNRRLLEDNLQQLEKLKQEAERLNQLLPAEIAALRARLIEGQPCPVCGSTHHPVAKNEDLQLMEEQKLKNAKEIIAKQIESLTAEIDNHKNGITRLTATIENNSSQYTRAFDSLALYLSDLPEWEKLFERAMLTAYLTSITTQWNSNTEMLAKTGETISKLETLIESEAGKWKEAEENVALKNERLSVFRNTVTQLLADRTKVLHGKPADEAEKYFIDQQNKINEKLKKAADHKNNLTNRQESLNGVISRIQTDIRQSEEKSEELKQEVDTWINENENFTYGLLTELLEKNSTWIQTEKQALKALTEAETTVKATLAERRQNLEQHLKSDAKPENESKETIDAILDGKNRTAESLTKRSTEIETILMTNNKALQQMKGLEKELNEKSALTENWKKLNVLLGSKTGSKFKEIAQGFTLDTLLLYANLHLQELAPRYRLQRIADRLALQVIDTDMLNEVRSIHSLSGGESFLVSLALALGLSSLSSNRMKVESLFIDEGFGSLDNDTLRIAMDALEQLQTQGRKIGVISHVTEITERIAVRINVSKIANDKSVIQVTG